MGVGISYMGTKRELAAAVADVIATCQPGPVLDVFSGMCSVAEAVAPKRPIWTNDVQVFAYQVAQALFLSSDLPLRSMAVADRFHERFAEVFAELSMPYAEALQAESDVLSAETVEELKVCRSLLSGLIEQANLRSTYRDRNLFATQYADTFVGLKQAIEIDAIVYLIHNDRQQSGDSARWFTIALGRAMLRISNSTGHFAQFLEPKQNNFKTFQRQRRRRVWTEWLDSNDDLEPAGNSAWRSTNRAFNDDTLSLVPALQQSNERPRVVYADPPYTNDQYSRYYHLLETLVLYDYPEMTGRGRYRPDRFSTDFSLKARAAQAIETLVASSASIGADIVLSYPTNGLVYTAGGNPFDMLKRHYRSVEICHSVEHTHSTFGASKGASKAAVTEVIYRGRS